MSHLAAPTPAREQADVLRTLLNPASVAVVGASAERVKLAGRSIPNLLEYGYRGRIYPVNPSASSVSGLPCYPSVEALPESPEVAIVATPASAVPAVLESLGRRGCRAATVLASGMEAPTGQTHPLWARCRQAIDRTGIRVMGPNSIGLINAWDRVVQRAAISLPRELQPGPLAVIAQSGAISLMVLHAMHVRGLGCGFCIPVGNEGDLGAADLLRALVRDGRTRVALLFLEAIRDARGLAAAAAEAAIADCTVVVCLAGVSARGRSVAESHTGAVAAPRRLAEAYLREAGAVLVPTIERLLDVGALLEGGWAPRRDGGLGVVCLSGGEGALTADLCEAEGAPLALLGPSTRDRIGEIIRFGAPTNPLDATADVLTHPDRLAALVAAVADDPATDLTCLSLAPVRAEDADGIFGALAEARVLERPDVVLARWPVADDPHQHAGIGRARVSSSSSLVAAYAAARRRAERFDDLPARAARFAARRWLDRPHGTPAVASAAEARLWLQAAGVPWVREWLAGSLEDVRTLAPQLSFPLAAKAVVEGRSHKSDWGGVEVGIDHPTALLEAAERLLDRAAQVAGPARVRGLLLQPIVGGREVLLGGVYDARLGPFVVVGPGGLLAEQLTGQLVLPAPVDVGLAHRRLAEAPFAWLLGPLRGQPAADADALAALVARFSEHLAASGDVLEAEVNPLMVQAAGAGVLGVDGRLVRAGA